MYELSAFYFYNYYILNFDVAVMLVAFRVFKLAFDV